MIGSVINNIFAQSEYLKSLSDDEMERYKLETKQEWEAGQKQMKKLELAEASRPRNFWGK